MALIEKYELFNMEQYCQMEFKVLERKKQCTEKFMFSYLLIIGCLDFLKVVKFFLLFEMITQQNCQKDQISFKVLDFVTKFGSTSSLGVNVNMQCQFFCVCFFQLCDALSLGKQICFTYFSKIYFGLINITLENSR